MKLDDMYEEFRTEFDKLKAARIALDELKADLAVKEDRHEQMIKEASQAYGSILR